MNDSYMLKSKNKINDISEIVKDQTIHQRRLLNKVEDHDLKLNTTEKYSVSSLFSFMSDVDQYPILKSATSSYTHFSNLSKMIESICLPDDSLASIQYFYDSVNTAIMTTLTSNKFLPDYGALSPNFIC